MICEIELYAQDFLPVQKLWTLKTMPLFHTIKIIVLMWWLLFASTLHAFYKIGVGKADITGPAVGSAMMCYANPEQISSGINDRQWARAFIIAEQDKSSRIAIVVIDAGAIFNSVYREVEERLYKLYGSLYTDQNLLISATHTHSAGSRSVTSLPL